MKQSDRVSIRGTFPVMQTAPRPWVRRVLCRLAHLAVVLALPAAAWAAPDVQGAAGIGKVCHGSPRADIVSSRLGVKLLAEASRDGDRTAIVGPLSHVIHGAGLTLDEEGTEAAAATAAIFSKSLEARFDMQVDRPFAVAVRSIESGELLFAAWVDDPGRSEPVR